MKFNYKTDFEINDQRSKFISTALKKEPFYVNKKGIIVSKEFPKNEFKNTSKTYSTKLWRDKDRIYYGEMLKLCDRYGGFNNVLEVGAGHGRFSKIFIEGNDFDSYDIYETSTFAVEQMREKFKNLSCNITIHNKSFKDISTKELEKYDCVIALEVLEHINWDKEFLSFINDRSWIFFSVPIIHSFNHVRAFLTPDSIAYRYREILDIHEIKEIVKHRKEKTKPKHYYPTHWGVVAKVEK